MRSHRLLVVPGRLARHAHRRSSQSNLARVTPDTLRAADDQSHAAPIGDLFAQPAARSAWGARAAIAALLVVAAGGLGMLVLPRNASAPAAASAAPAPAIEAVPLELLSLRYTRQDDNLAITGLVLNPRSGKPLSRVVATAFAFGPDGGFLASGRAPLDFTTLAPGDESPFVVQIPVKGDVARYRIGFRAEDGDVIGHVDKRAAAEAVARK